MNRRTALKLGASLAVVGGTGLYGGYLLVPPRRSRALEPVDALAQRLYVSLDAEQRAKTCVSYDHPLRQYHNRGVEGGGRSILGGFTREQRRTLTDLLYAGLSESGRQRLPEQDLIRWTGVHSMHVVICGDPTAPPYQIILTGLHLNLRLGGKSREGAAFGGPQVYGDQRGNGRVGLPGNVYREQFVLAHRILRSLDSGRRRHAVLEEAPVQTQIELQGRHGVFAGIPVKELESEGKALAHELVKGILSTYPPNDVAYARECLVANGGLDALYLGYYQHGEDGEIPEGQVFRLEGPSAVFYFRGYPHVHAFINVAMDGDSPLSVGEPLGDNPALLEGANVKRLFEAAMRDHAGSDFAYYDRDSVAGRLRKGPIRSGDIYTLESSQDSVTHVESKGSNLSATLVEELRDRGVDPNTRRGYTVATTGYVSGKLAAEKLGRVESRQKSGLLRDVTITY